MVALSDSPRTLDLALRLRSRNGDDSLELLADMGTRTAALAILGGKPVRDRPFPEYRPYGMGERNAAYSVVASGMLSGFVGAPGDAFFGGHHVRNLEKEWCEHFGMKHAVSFNSGTSALTAACAAIGVTNGREVIVTPWSMSASVTCVNLGTPVFADVEPETYGLDPERVKAKISRRTRAIVAVHLFGCPARIEELGDIAYNKGIALIEDAAQAPGALLGMRPMGTFGTIGVFSLNQHKTIHCGEGGVAVTNDGELAKRMELYRNHGETVDSETIGGNFRLGEIHAAIARVQLGRLEELTAPRIAYANRLSDGLSDLDGIVLPIVPDDSRHVFYRYVVRVPDADRFAKAVRAEGVPVTAGYVEPLYRLRALGRFAPDEPLPVVERMHREAVLLDPHAGLSDGDIDDAIAAFRKVWEHREEL